MSPAWHLPDSKSRSSSNQALGTHPTAETDALEKGQGSYSSSACRGVEELFFGGGKALDH